MTIYQHSKLAHLRHISLNLMAATDSQARTWLSHKFLISWTILYQVLIEKETVQHKNIALSNEKSDLKNKIAHLK